MPKVHFMNKKKDAVQNSLKILKTNLQTGSTNLQNTEEDVCSDIRRTLNTA